MALSGWSTTAASNATVGSINWAEGQAPSTVNDSARYTMADVATWLGQASGAIPEYLSSVAGTNTVTAGGPAQMAGYVTGQRFHFTPAATNTGATTLNITPSGGAALGAKNIFSGGSACVGGELVISVPVIVVYDGTQFNIVTPALTKGATNLLINPDGIINARCATTAIADDTYDADRWYTLTQTSTITYAQQADVANGTPYMMRMTQAQAVAQRMGRAQIILGDTSKKFRGKAVTLTVKAQISSSQALRYAILEWTGTKDSVTSDVVLDWTSGTYTAGNFFLAANLTVTAVASQTPSAATLTTLAKLTATLGSSVNNIIVMVWTEGTAAQNVTLDIAAQLEPGSLSTDFEVRPYEVEESLCEFYYQKSFARASAPAQNFGNTGSVTGFAIRAGAAADSFNIFLQRSMRANPTVTLYNPGAANGEVRDLSAGADCSASSVNGTFSERGHLLVTTTGNAASAVANTLAVHYQAVSEL